MFKNYIVDEDLEKYYPNLSEFLWKKTTSYATQIQEAFDFVSDEMRHRGIDLRKYGKSLDLKRAVDSTADQNVLTSTVELTGTTQGYIVGQDAFNRFVVNVTAITGTPTFTLEGSNDVKVTPSAPPANWQTITSLKPIKAGEITIVFNEEFRYYRLVSTVAASVTYTASLVETTIDRLVVWMAFSIIFHDFSREATDIWAMRAVKAEEHYQNHLRVIRFMTDEDEDNKVTEADRMTRMSARMGR